MATDTVLQEEDPETLRKRQLGTQDPLFYEGKTPVLGEDVSVQEPAGELTFPEAGPGPAPPPGVTNAAMPPFPEFNMEMPEPPVFNFPGGEPPVPPDIQLPQLDEPWWQQGLDVAQTGAAQYANLQKLGAMPAEGAYPTVSPGELAQYGPEGEALFPQGSPESLGGPGTQSPEALFPEGSPGFNWGAIGPGLQTAGGIYSLYNAVDQDNPQGMALAAPQIVGGASSLAAALAPGALGALAPGMAALGPAAGLLSLPLIAGKLYEKYGPGSADKIRTPPGFNYVPGSGNSRGVGGLLVDPATGRMLQYKGNGKYTWADETTQGMPATPEQFKQWGIEPTGKLAQRPEYAAITKSIRDEDIAQAGTFQPGTTVPHTPTEAHQRSYLEEWRQPYIDQIKAQHPTASEGEIWRLYTLTSYYQQEQDMKAGWAQNPGSAPGGEPSEGGTGESNAPGGNSGAPSGGGAENY